MISKKVSKNRVWKAIFGSFLGIVGIFVALCAPMISPANTGAVDGDMTEPVYLEEIQENTERNDASDSGTDGDDVQENDEDGVEDGDSTGENEENGQVTATTTANKVVSDASCKNSLGELGWWVCPRTGKISEAVDWLYDKIEGVLAINPVEIKDGAPIYELWKYFRGVTNIVFIIFLLVVIYSQITGYGISNYGIKKALPKLIVVAILVNLSFIMCSVLVDVSNAVGNGMRGLFDAIEETTLATTNVSGTSHVAMAEMYSALSGGTALAVGGAVIAFESGAIWMLIPVALGAIVAVATGLITIALRQAVVALLVMIAPLAIVAHMLPNTENLFKKWKNLLTKMLVFYPLFSLLFGASSLAGWAIIVGAKDGFMLLLGVAVQIFPLFFAWSLMKMSGTFLGNINARMRGIMAKPLASNTAWAGSHRDATKAKHLAAGNAYTPSMRLRQFLSDRKIAREADAKENMESVQLRGLAYGARRHYRKDGTVSQDGEEAYGRQARNMQYQQKILRDKNNFEKGLGQIVGGSRDVAQKARLGALDIANVKAADSLKIEQARTERITYDNARGFYNRMEDAVNAHMDILHGGEEDYRMHDIKDRVAAIERYNEASKIMEGEVLDVQYATATAAHNYDTQMQVVMKKMQKYFEMTPPTKDLRMRMKEFSLSGKATDNIDLVISGLREINRRGDTDIVKNILDDVIDEGLTLGTHASQSVASFLMFDVKDSDPFLRRFGKYINLETARMYDKNKRQKAEVDFDEYVKGYHIEPDGSRMIAKKPMSVLLQGTSFDNIERTAMANMRDAILKVYGDSGGEATPEAIEALSMAYGASAPQLLSASLKYLSGSEGLRSVVEFITGYRQKVDDTTGEEIWEALWDDKKRFSDERQRDRLREFYREQTEKYLKGQTPSQLLKLRTDYKTPIIKHLSDGWLGFLAGHRDDPEYADMATEYADYLEEYEAKMAGAGGKTLDEVDSDFANDVTRERIREVLGDGVMRRILITANRSSAANETKAFARDWYGIDDEAYRAKMGVDNAKGGKRNKQKPTNSNVPSGDSSDGGGATGGGGYGNFRDWMNLSSTDFDLRGDVGRYYAESVEALRNFGMDVIASEYEKFYAENSDKITGVADLEQALERLMGEFPDDADGADADDE
ncbi:hypothetical protein IJG04_03010 [Candidatus Saccharibacteria bacterium]|nr:hypothetical protein [Candidatus Saccharibacteria bacterium]